MEGGFDTRVQIVAIIATGLMFLFVLELVRRRRLTERYALLWMVAAAALLVLAVWRDLLDIAADALGVASPPNAVFLVAFGVAFALLLHFSVAISRLSDEAKILSQEVARLDQELRAARVANASGNGVEPATETAQGPAAEREPAPSKPQTTDQ